MHIQRLIAIAAMVWSSLGLAQVWPTRPVTLLVPTAPGGVIDSVARAMAEEMGKRLGQPFIVENRSGAAGMLAVQGVARAQPDGYTLLVGNSTPIINAPFMFTRIPYDPRRDLSFITQICAGQLLFTVNTGLVPARTMQEFVAWARRHQGKVSYGSYGTGSVGHLIGAYLSQTRELDMTHVAYKGEAPMVQDMLAGQIAWGITSALTAGPHLKTGRLRALAVIGDKRAAELPELPTMAEAGLPEPELRIAGWIGLMAPAGTPAPVIDRLEEVARAAAQSTPMRARFQAYAMEPIANSASEFLRDIERSTPVVERLIRLAGVQPQ